MNFQFYFEKLQHSDNFKKFIERNPKAFLCSAFFSIDKVGNDNQQHFDYFLDKKIYSFQVEANCKIADLENYGGRVLTQISSDYDFEFEKVEKMILDKMQEGKVKNKIQKLLLSLQNAKGVDYIIGTIFISGMGLLRVKIDLDEMRIVDFEKASVFDIVKVVRGNRKT